MYGYRATIWLVSVSVLSSLSAQAQSSPGGRVIAVTLNVTLEKFEGPCGSKLALSGNITVTAPGKVWYRFVAPAGVTLVGGAETGFGITDAGPLGVGTDAIFSKATKGEFRLEAAMQGSDGKHGAVTQSSVVPCDFKCSGRASGVLAGPANQAAPANQPGSSQRLPPELPLPPGVSVPPHSKK